MNALENWLEVIDWYHRGDSRQILFEHSDFIVSEMKGFMSRCRFNLKIETVNGYIEVSRL